MGFRDRNGRVTRLLVAVPCAAEAVTIRERRAEIVDVLVQALLTKRLADSTASRASS